MIPLKYPDKKWFAVDNARRGNNSYCRLRYSGENQCFMKIQKPAKLAIEKHPMQITTCNVLSQAELTFIAEVITLTHIHDTDAM